MIASKTGALLSCRIVVALTMIAFASPSPLALAAGSPGDNQDGSNSAKAGIGFYNSTIGKDREPLSEYSTAEDRMRQKFRDFGRKLAGGKPLCVANPSREQGPTKLCGYDNNGLEKMANFSCHMELKKDSCEPKCIFDSCVPSPQRDLAPGVRVP